MTLTLKNWNYSQVRLMMGFTVMSLPNLKIKLENSTLEISGKMTVNELLMITSYLEPSIEMSCSFTNVLPSDASQSPLSLNMSALLPYAIGGMIGSNYQKIHSKRRRRLRRRGKRVEGIHYIRST